MREAPVWTLESRPNPCVEPVNPDTRHFRDYPLTGHAADIPRSTRMEIIIQFLDLNSVKLLPFIVGLRLLWFFKIPKCRPLAVYRIPSSRWATPNSKVLRVRLPTR